MQKTYMGLQKIVTWQVPTSIIAHSDALPFDQYLFSYTYISWAIGVVTHLLAMPHLWVFHNNVFLPWLDNAWSGPCCWAPSLWGSSHLVCIWTPGSPIYQMKLHWRALFGFSPVCPSHEPPMLACSHHPGPSSRPTAASSKDLRYASCTPPSFTLLPHPLRAEFDLALAFSALQSRWILLTIIVSGPWCHVIFP